MISLRGVLLVAAGGLVGAVLRFLLVGAVQRALPAFPFGTLSVNVLGCLAIGALGAWTQARQPPPELWLFTAVGLLGGFTTFSALGWETFVLLREAGLPRAFANVALQLALGLAAVWLGYTTASRS